MSNRNLKLRSKHLAQHLLPKIALVFNKSFLLKVFLISSDILKVVRQEINVEK